MKYRSAEQRKKRIVRFLEKQPLSTIREISDKYDRKMTNYAIVKKDITKLLEENKIGIIYGMFFVNPVLGQELVVLKRMMRSDVILLPRFKKIVFDDNNGIDEVTFEQNVRNCICLFHLKLKIHFFEQKKYLIRELSWTKKQSLAKKFQTQFIKFLETYSDMDLYLSFLKFTEEYERKRNPNWSKPETLKDALKRFSNFLYFYYYYDTLRFSTLKSHKISVNEEVERIKKWVVTGSKTAAAEAFGIKNKALQKSLGNIQKIGQYKIHDAMVRRLAEKGQNANSGKVFNLIFYPLVGQILKLPKKQQLIARKEFKKEWDKDIFEFVDPKAFDTS
jgi:hypothetical protein